MNFARIARLRDKLLDAGRPSVRPAPSSSRTGLPPEQSALYGRVEPLAELMFLVMSSDGAVAKSERAALRGMLRTLTDGALSSREMDEMLEHFAAVLEREGIEQRLDTLAARLYGEHETRELALALGAATALADSELQASEVTILKGLAERFGVPASRLQALIEGAE